MRTILLLGILIAACGGGENPPAGTDAPAIDAPSTTDGPAVRQCDGRAYDKCATPGGNECANGVECRLFGMQGFTICAPACNASTPCPNDELGNPVSCNMMGRCRSAAPNNCTLP
jgi:hypothetical protein